MNAQEHLGAAFHAHLLERGAVERRRPGRRGRSRRHAIGRADEEHLPALLVGGVAVADEHLDRRGRGGATDELDAHPDRLEARAVDG